MEIQKNPYEAFVAEAKEQKWDIYGFEVFENGQILYEWYPSEKSVRHPIYSATKTITSLAAGLAADEGKLKLQSSVYDCLCEAAKLEQIANLGFGNTGATNLHQLLDGLDGKRVRDLKIITLERLLTMSVEGYPFRPSGEHWLECVLKINLPDAGKRSFSYSNIPAYLVGVLTELAVGENLYEYLQPRFFEPLGIEHPPYKTCPDGHFYGASGMELTVEELRRIGELLLNGGSYGGRQLVSSSYIQAATSLQQKNREGGYGYSIWKLENGFSINGKWGQKCLIIPGKRRIVTCLAHVEEEADVLKKALMSCSQSH